MPRITIECNEDKLLHLVPILLKEGIKHMISPDKVYEVVNINPIQKDFFKPEHVITIASGESVPREVKHVHHVKGRTLVDIVLEYFTDLPNTILSSYDVGLKIETLGFKSVSASTTLNTLYAAGKLTRIKQNRMFYYSLIKSDDINI